MSYRKPKPEELANLRRRLRHRLRLTDGERFMLHRRAKGMTQAAAADLRGVSRDTLRAWEDDYGRVPKVAGVSVATLPFRELCYVWRRRLGITLEELAGKLDRCTSWVHQAEQGRAGAFEITAYIERRRRAEEG